MTSGPIDQNIPQISPICWESSIRVHPPLELKPINELAPGELILTPAFGGRSLAIGTRLSIQGGSDAPALIYLPAALGPAARPHYVFLGADDRDRVASFGTGYAFVPDPIWMPQERRTDAPPVQLLLARKARLLHVWDQHGSRSIALNLDTGLAQVDVPMLDAWECHAWEIRLETDGKVDWMHEPLFRWQR